MLISKITRKEFFEKLENKKVGLLTGGYTILNADKIFTCVSLKEDYYYTQNPVDIGILHKTSKGYKRKDSYTSLCFKKIYTDNNRLFIIIQVNENYKNNVIILRLEE